MNNNKYICLLAVLALWNYNLSAQVITVLPGTDLIIKSGTVFSADSITLIPSTDFILNDISLNKNTTILNSSYNSYISRVYQFSNTSIPFTGTVQLYYQEGSELNSLDESGLQLNIFDGATWQAIASSIDLPNNSVTATLANMALNEMTLASIGAPLPLTWISFTAGKQNGNVLLQWSTGIEQNTSEFGIMHSLDGYKWNKLGTLPAAGNSSNSRNYSYVHRDPAIGSHFYRILQMDLDSRNTYSDTRTIRIGSDKSLFTILGNPVTNGALQLEVNSPHVLYLYGGDGKLLFVKQMTAGRQSIDVSGYVKGVYYLKGGQIVSKILIQ